MDQSTTDASTQAYTDTEAPGEMLRPNCTPYTPTMRIIGAFMCVLIVVSNLLTIATMVKTRRKIGSKSRLYVTSLSCFDLLMAPAFGLEMTLSHLGYLCVDGRVPEDINMDTKRYALFATMLLRIVAFKGALFTILVAGLDRLVAVSKPIWYKTYATSFRIKILILMVTAYCTTLALCVMLYYLIAVPDALVKKAFSADTILPRNIYNWVLLPQTYYIVIPGNVISYCLTYYKIRKQLSKGNKGQKNKNLEKTRRFFHMMVGTLVAMLIVYLPFYIAFGGLKIGKPGHVPAWVFSYVGQPCILLIISNTWINILLYCWFNQDYRQAYINLIRFGCRRVAPQENTSINDSTAMTGLN